MSGSGTEMVDLDAEMEQDVEAPTGAESKTEEARVSKNVTLSGLQIYDDAEDFYDAKPQIPLKHYGFGNGKAGVQELQIGSCGKNGQWLMKPGFLNPWASLIGFSTLLGFALYCIISPKDAKTQLAVWQSWCTMMFSWFYIASQNVWIVFLFVVYYYYGNVRLGKQTDKPEFDNSTYFAMLFSCGVAVGLFVYGTAEPLYHYDYWVKHRFNGGGHETQNDKANFAILTTMFHWGFHGWCVYTLVGLQMGIMAYKYMLPMTMRTCFYPLLHKHTWGWIGSCIDGFSIVTIVAGVCTSLGLGAVQIRRGLEGMETIVYNGAPTDGYLINDVWSEETATWSTKLVNAGIKTTGSKADGLAGTIGSTPDDQLLLIIWMITLFATVSVVSGIHFGIKTLSQLAFGMGLFILGVAFFLGNTPFFLGNMSQAVGYYLQYFMTQLGWHTDAFAQLGHGEGAAPDGKGASKSGQQYGGSPSFMDGWTIFYWGWWIAWSPFVGSFIARISRGRSIAEVINYSLTGPLIFSFLWFGVFGGAAIAMENNAQSLWMAGRDLYNDPTYFQAGQGNNVTNPAQGFTSSYATQPVGPSKSGFGTGTDCGKFEVDETSAGFGYCAEGGTHFAKNFENADMSLMTKLNMPGCVPLGYKKFRNASAGAPAKQKFKVSKGCGACFVQQTNFSVMGLGKYQNETKTGCEMYALNNPGMPCPFYIKSWAADAGLSPQCLFTDWDQEASWYNLMGQYYTLGPFLQGLSIVTLSLYFVTSSDSGSLVVDMMAANGRDEQNPLQRVLWAVVEGLVATGLVVGGASDGGGGSKNVLKALQAASICCGLPFTFLLCFMMPALWYGLSRFNADGTLVSGLKEWREDHDSERTHFRVPIYGGIFDAMEWLFCFGGKFDTVDQKARFTKLEAEGEQGAVKFPDKFTWAHFFVSLLCPPLIFYDIYAQLDHGHHTSTMIDGEKVSWGVKMWNPCMSEVKWNSIISPIVAAILFYAALICICFPSNTGIWGVGWCLYFMFAGMLTMLRKYVRTQIDIDGNMFEDFFSSLVLYPCCLSQIYEEVLWVTKHPRELKAHGGKHHE